MRSNQTHMETIEITRGNGISQPATIISPLYTMSLSLLNLFVQYILKSFYVLLFYFTTTVQVDAAAAAAVGQTSVKASKCSPTISPIAYSPLSAVLLPQKYSLTTRFIYIFTNIRDMNAVIVSA